MKHFLIPTDFSESANNAIEFAVQSANIFPAEIYILHAFEMNTNMQMDNMGVLREFSQSLLEEAQLKIAELKKSIEANKGISVKTIVAKLNFKDAIQQALKDMKFDLIIMGTQGASGIKEKLWGTNTAAIISESTIPVLAIPHDYTWKKPKKFLLSTNHFEEDPSLLNFVFELSDLYMAQVHAVVFTDEDDDKPATFIEHSHKRSQYEQTLKEHHKDDLITVTQLFGSIFEETLQHHILENEIDLLVMITYQRGFFSRLFHPSMTNQMAYHTNIPLLAIPAKID